MKKLFILLFFTPFIAKSQCTELFFSEYIEGTSFNKAIEIYNPTPTPVNLTGYVLRLYSNGSAVPSASLNLTGTINPGDVFVVAHPSANASVLAQADMTSGSVINFNGDDALDLFNGTITVDVFGTIGVDPGTSWTIDGNPTGALNKTCRRKSPIQMGTTTWAGQGENQWIVYPLDADWYLGSHVMNTCGSTLFGNGTGNGFCQDQASSFFVLATGGTAPYSYFWEFGDGTGLVNGGTVSYQWATAGTYNVTFIVIDAAMNVYSQTFPFTVNPAPTACFTHTLGNGCAPDTIVFTNCSSGGTTPLNYAWTFGNGNTDNTANPPQQIYNAGSFTPQLILVDANGCNDTVTSSIVVNAQENAGFSYAQSSYCPTDPNPTPIITGDPGTFSCNGCSINSSTGEIDISLTPNGNYTVTYTTSGTCSASSTFNLSIYSTSPDPTITPAGPFCTADVATNLTAASGGGSWSGTGITDPNNGTFDPATAGNGTHTITYTIPGACGASDNTTIVVNQTPSITISNSDTTVCNDIFMFALQANSGGTWSGAYVSDVGSGAGGFNLAGTPAGVYYAVYTISGTCPNADSIMVTVEDAPMASFSFNNNGNTIDFTSTSTNSTTYLWEVDENGTITNDNNASWTYTFTNPSETLYVCLTAYNLVGCESITCQNIYPTGVNTVNEEQVLIYPNPTNGIINLKTSSTQNRTLVLRNLLGEEVGRWSTNGNKQMTLDLNQLVPGAYFLTINGLDTTSTYKIIKR